MRKPITSFVGLDTHIDSIAIGVAPRGRQQPHFLGTVPPQRGALSRALGRLGKSISSGLSRTQLANVQAVTSCVDGAV
jgi:hypothetical protein